MAHPTIRHLESYLPTQDASNVAQSVQPIKVTAQFTPTTSKPTLNASIIAFRSSGVAPSPTAPPRPMISTLELALAMFAICSYIHTRVDRNASIIKASLFKTTSTKVAVPGHVCGWRVQSPNQPRPNRILYDLARISEQASEDRSISIASHQVEERYYQGASLAASVD
mgnify:FL=1